MRKPALVNIDLVDCEFLSEEIDEKTGEKIQTYKMKWQQEGMLNSNNREYPKGLLEREIKRILPAVREKKVYGSAYHPGKGEEAKTVDAALLWKDVWIEKDGACYGKAEVLPTRVGKDVQALMSRGKIGISSRGYGTTTQVAGKGGKPFNRVNDNFRLITPGDVVLSPSVIDTGVTEALVEELEARFSIAEEEHEKLHNLNVGGNKLDIKTAEDLRKEYSDFVKQIEDAAVESAKNEIDKLVDAKVEEKKEEWKTEIEATITDKVAEATKAVESTLEKVREKLVELFDIEGFMPPPSEENTNTEGNQTTDPETKKEIESLKAKNKELEDKMAAKDKAEEDAKADVELQKKLKEGLDTELEKEANKKYASLIEKELTKDGRILIEAEDKIEETVKSTKKRLSDLFVEAKKNEIVKENLEELGHVGDPEGGPETKTELTEDEIMSRRYEEALEGGYQGSLADYKKEFAEKKKE